MDTQLIALATPVFFVLILVELLVAKLQGRPQYRFHDAINSISCGIGEQVVLLFTGALGLVGYSWSANHLALTHISASSPIAWIVLFFLVDHSYYWFHRASHRVNFLWAGHSVHHQSEDYNLSTALRQNWIENLLMWPFYVPLAIAGFSLEMMLIVSTFNTLYQFWIHTRTIDKLGPAEGILNTPASHRVHHGINPKYIDKNYGGMSMIWDRMFGTYEPEIEEPVFGIVKPLASWNPVWANVEGWAKIAKIAAKTSSFRDKVAIWFAPPEWLPRDHGGPVTVPEVDHDTYRKFETEVSDALKLYVAVQFLVVTAVTTALMWFDAQLTRTVAAGATLWVLASIVAWGALFEKKRWAVGLEVARWVAVVPLAMLAMRH